MPGERGQRVHGVIALVALLVPVIAPATARANGAGVIATSVRDRSAVASAMATAMTGRTARIVDDAVTTAVTAHAAGAVPIEILAAFRRVRTQIDIGWKNYLRVAIEPSRDALVAARTAAEPLVALPGGAELYADAALRLGMLLGASNRRTEGNAILALAVALDPERPVTTAEFSPELVELVDVARSSPVALHTVHITSSPSGARIRVDNKDVGTTPLDVQLTRNQHLIVARAPHHRATVQGITPDATEIDVQLEPDEEGARLAAGAAPGMSAAAAQLLVDASLRYADLDEVVLVADTTRRGGAALLVQRCAGPAPARCSAVVELDYGTAGSVTPGALGSATKSAWQAVLAGDLLYPPSVLGEQAAGDSRDRPWYRSPYVWTGVGAVVVAGIVIAIVATSGSQPPPDVGIDGGAFGRP